MLKIAYFLGFYDAYNEYFSNKKQLFGLPDDQIITSRESLVWKIYAKKPKEDDKKNESPNQNVNAHKKSPMKGKENVNKSNYLCTYSTSMLKAL